MKLINKFKEYFVRVFYEEDEGENTSETVRTVRLSTDDLGPLDLINGGVGIYRYVEEKIDSKRFSEARADLELSIDSIVQGIKKLGLRNQGLISYTGMLLMRMNYLNNLLESKEEGENVESETLKNARLAISERLNIVEIGLESLMTP